MSKEGIIIMCSIKIDKLEKSFKDRIIIKECNYEFSGHHVYGIIGKNGVGKSVLMKMLLGVMKPSSGSVLYNDDLKNIRMSCIVDGCDLFMNMSGLDNLVYLSGFMKKISREEVRKCMVEVGLNPDNKTKIKKYSLGMRKRLLIAQAIMEDPDILIMDEPTNSLDVDGVQMLHRLVRESKNKGKLIIVASHYAEDIESICDTILELKDGMLCSKKEQ